LANPTPTRKGPVATTQSLRETVADLLVVFDGVPLLDELASAVVADCLTQRTLPPAPNTSDLAEFTEGKRKVNNTIKSREGTQKTKGKNIDAKMMKTLAAKPESIDWPSGRWADELDCAESTVRGTDTWRV
jgi:hypothetical protein